MLNFVDVPPEDRWHGPLRAFLDTFDPRLIASVQYSSRERPPEVEFARVAHYRDRNGVTFQFCFNQTIASIVRCNLNDGIVSKAPQLYGEYEVEPREVYWLKRLKGGIVAPELLSAEKGTIVTRYCGEALNIYNLPQNWRLQAESLLAQLEAAGCAHNDIKADNILVADGRLMLIDFAWATDIGAPIPPHWPELLGLDHRLGVHQFDDRKAMFEAISRVEAAAAAELARQSLTPPEPQEQPRQ